MYASDEEQVEALKRWWRENGRSVVAGVIIAVIALMGWQQWTAYRQRVSEAASTEYLAFLDELQKEDAGQGVLERGEAILQRYHSTPYGTLTAFWLAQYHVEQKQFPAAAESLRWALDHAKGEALKHVARIRLARVFLAQAQYQDALDLLSMKEAGAFASQYEELRGDIYTAQGMNQEAASAYEKALADQQLDPLRRSIIELKLNDLGATAEPFS